MIVGNIYIFKPCLHYYHSRSFENCIIWFTKNNNLDQSLQMSVATVSCGYLNYRRAL